MRHWDLAHKGDEYAAINRKEYAGRLDSSSLVQVFN